MQGQVAFWKKLSRDLQLNEDQIVELNSMRQESVNSIDSLYIVRRMLAQQVQVRWAPPRSAQNAVLLATPCIVRCAVVPMIMCTAQVYCVLHAIQKSVVLNILYATQHAIVRVNPCTAQNTEVLRILSVLFILHAVQNTIVLITTYATVSQSPEIHQHAEPKQRLPTACETHQVFVLCGLSWVSRIFRWV